MDNKNHFDEAGCLHLDRETTLEITTLLRDLCITVVDESRLVPGCLGPDRKHRKWWMGCYAPRYAAGSIARKLGMGFSNTAPRALSQNCHQLRPKETSDDE